MDMRSVLQLPRNVLEGMTFKLGGNSIFPSIELSGKGLLELHGDSIWLVSTIGSSFLKSQILWTDWTHEFKFVEPEKRGLVCQLAFQKSAEALKLAIAAVPGKTGAHLTFVNSLVALEAHLDVASRNLVVSRHDYNAWVRSTGGDSSEGMTEDEHLQSLLDTIRDVRLQTYPLWASLIALLPPGPVKTEAEARFKTGCASVGLDTGDVSADWTPIQ